MKKSQRENLCLKNPKNKKLIDNIKSKEQKYSFKKELKSKVGNSQFFCNIKGVNDDGILMLKTGEFATLYEVQAIDLTLSSKHEKESFFYSLKYLYQIKELNLKCYKLDKRINLNMNKDYTRKLIAKYSKDSINSNLVKEKLELIEKLEKENLTLSSSYYFVIISKNIDTLKKQMQEVALF